MVMHGVYNAETFEKLIIVIQQMHNIKILNERLFAGKIDTSFTWYIKKMEFITMA